MILIVTRRFAPAPRIKTRRFGPDKRLSAIAKSVPATSLPILAVIGPSGPAGSNGAPGLPGQDGAFPKIYTLPTAP